MELAKAYNPQEAQQKWLQFWNDQGYFLMRGLEKVRAEMSLSALAYHIKRVRHLLGIPTLLATVA